ncbi:MAG: FtsX-like permease family protein, partial [Mucinivorans sp.]
VNFDYLPYDQAMEFKHKFSIPSSISLSMRVTGGATAKYLSTKTNPNVRVVGVDDNFLRNKAMDLSSGRNFSAIEVSAARPVAIIGSAVASTLFENESPIDKYINVSGGQYRVIGVIKSKGSSMGMGNNQDQQIIIPITTARANFSLSRPDVPISVVPDDPKMLDVAASEAEGLFRVIRGLSATDENDFAIERSDSMVAMMLDNIKMITLVASLIGFITLLGAAIGLMNIMLVSVAERTREIGTRKALGARPMSIRLQFLFEAIIISQMGGVFGIIFGILIGNVVGLMTGAEFFVPWLWMTMGVVICLVVGVSSGYLPANKAAKMDPVEALRYE